jgi:hypothetical protein
MEYRIVIENIHIVSEGPSDQIGVGYVVRYTLLQGEEDSGLGLAKGCCWRDPPDVIFISIFHGCREKR